MSVNENKQLHDYSDEEHYSRSKAIITALLKWLQCEFFGLFIFLSLFALRAVIGKGANVLFGILGILTYGMVVVDFGSKEGKKAYIKNTIRGDNVKRGFGFVLGLINIIPPMISLLFLGLSYSGVIPSVLFPFKMLNIGLWGIIDLFVDKFDITTIKPALFAVFSAVQLLFAAATGISFAIGHANEDIVTKIVYKENNG